MDTAFPSRTRTRNRVTDKRAALLRAATRLFAQDGLQNVTTSAIAKAAGVGKGTLFLYFETKEKLLNELYIEIVTELIDALDAVLDPKDSAEALLRSYWFGYARWYFDHREAANVRLQCEISSVLTPESIARKDAMEVELSRTYFQGILERMEGTLWRYVAHAFTVGPIQVLAQIRDKGEIEITEELLEATFAGVQKVVTMTPD